MICVRKTTSCIPCRPKFVHSFLCVNKKKYVQFGNTNSFAWAVSCLCPGDRQTFRDDTSGAKGLGGYSEEKREGEASPLSSIEGRPGCQLPWLLRWDIPTYFRSPLAIDMTVQFFSRRTDPCQITWDSPTPLFHCGPGWIRTGGRDCGLDTPGLVGRGPVVVVVTLW